jgi:hypothetical protein
MKNKMWTGIFLGLIVSLLVVACKTPPQTADTANLTGSEVTSDPNLGPPDAAAVSALNDAKTRAENARKQAQYLDGQTYFPEDWDAAESQYRAAGEQEASTLGGAREAANKYNAAAGAYDDISRQAIPLYAQAREAEIVQARAGAVAAGIADISPERLAAADTMVRQAYELYQGEDYYSAAESAITAIDMYGALKTGAEGYTLWQEIETYGLGGYDSANYALAVETGLLAVDDYDGGRVEKAQVEGDAALARLKTVLAAGWESFAVERRDAANAERQAALDLKANVAVRNEFNAALAVYNQGETSFRTQRYDDAANLYVQSESMFTLTKNSAADKRRLAEEAIRAAEEKAAQSDITAQNAERIIEGGVQ